MVGGGCGRFGGREQADHLFKLASGVEHHFDVKWGRCGEWQIAVIFMAVKNGSDGIGIRARVLGSRPGCYTGCLYPLSFTLSMSSHSPAVYFISPLLSSEGRPGMFDASPLSGISGLSFDSTLLSPLLFFCLVLLPFLSYRFLPAGPFF